MFWRVAVLAIGPTITSGASWIFNITEAHDLQDGLFGDAVRGGWLGSDVASSFGVGDRHIWMFGDSFTNLTSDSQTGQAAEGSSLCNYFSAQNCAMPTNSFAQLDSLRAPLKFHSHFDGRSDQPTSVLWPPGWGGNGVSPKTPKCEGCSLWQAPTVLHQSESQCVADGAEGVEKDKGGCCSTISVGCPGYCCHDELYFRPLAGMGSLAGDRVLIMAEVGKASKVMPNNGQIFGTYVVAVNNVGSGTTPEDWDYSSSRMPDTHVWPWSLWNATVQFSLAISKGHVDAAPDLVYLLGLQGRSRVLARANLTDLLDFRWEGVQFWSSAGPSWQAYNRQWMPKLQPLWNFRPAEGASLHYDERLRTWLVPEVDSETKMLFFRTAYTITGPYKMLMVGSLPADTVRGSDLSDWDVKSVKSHPELASSSCNWVLSVILHWRLSDKDPPVPGLHKFPRLLCVQGNYTWAVRQHADDDATVHITEPTTTLLLTTHPEPTAMTTKTTTMFHATPHPVGDPVLKLPPTNPHCNPGALLKIMNNMACSDMGDGCHTCRARAEWIARHNGRSVDVAYGIVASEFPAGCGKVLTCQAELAQMSAIQQAWEVEAEVNSPALRGGSVGHAATWIKACVLGSSLPLSLALGVFFLRYVARRRQSVGALMMPQASLEETDVDDASANVRAFLHVPVL